MCIVVRNKWTAQQEWTSRSHWMVATYCRTESLHHARILNLTIWTDITCTFPLLCLPKFLCSFNFRRILFSLYCCSVEQSFPFAILFLLFPFCNFAIFFLLVIQSFLFASSHFVLYLDCNPTGLLCEFFGNSLPMGLWISYPTLDQTRHASKNAYPTIFLPSVNAYSRLNSSYYCNHVPRSLVVSCGLRLRPKEIWVRDYIPLINFLINGTYSWPKSLISLRYPRLNCSKTIPLIAVYP